MSLPELDTSVGHSFGLEIDGNVITEIHEVDGLKLEQDVIELRLNAADGKFVIKKLPGRFKAGEVTLTRGLTDDQSFENWVQSSGLGKSSAARTGGAIIVFDFDGNPIKRLKLENVSLKSLQSGAVKAGDSSVLTEKLVLTFEGLEAE
jgi:phage tail-like protein